VPRWFEQPRTGLGVATVRQRVFPRARGLVPADCILEQFGRDRNKAQRGYRQFVAQGRGSSPWEQLKGQVYLGSESFVASLPEKDAALCEIPKMQRFVDRPALSEIFSTGQSIEAIHRAYRDCGYTQREIAQHLGVHYATISRRIRKWKKDSETVRNVDLQNLTLRSAFSEAAGSCCFRRAVAGRLLVSNLWQRCEHRSFHARACEPFRSGWLALHATSVNDRAHRQGH